MRELYRQSVGLDIPVVRMAPEKVERVLHNLLANALRHTPSDGAVAVVVESETDSVRVTVEDSGEGLTTAATRRLRKTPIFAF